MVEEPYDFDWSEWDAHVNKTLPNASKIIDTSRNLTDTKSLRFSFEKGLLELSNGGELIFKLLQFARIIIEGKSYDEELNRVLCAATEAFRGLYEVTQSLASYAVAKASDGIMSSEIREATTMLTPQLLISVVNVLCVTREGCIGP